MSQQIDKECYFIIFHQNISLFVNFDKIQQNNYNQFFNEQLIDLINKQKQLKFI